MWPTLILSLFWFFALFNPVYMKYDYGGGYPVLVVFGVLLAFLAVVEWRKQRERSPVEKWSLGVFSAAVILSFAYSQAQTFGFSEVLAFLLAVTFYIVYAYRENKWMGKFLNVLRWSALLSLVIGFYVYLFRDEPRMIGPFFNKVYHSHVWPNAFALFLLMVWPIFLVTKWRVVSVSFLLGALMLTYSRGALIVLSGQTLLLLIYFAKRIHWREIMLIALTGALALGIFYGTSYLRGLEHEVINVEERATFGNQESLTSKQERVDFWLSAIELMKEKPLLGWGPYSFRNAYPPIQTTFLGFSDHPHNVFLKIGMENGVIALGAFLLFLLAAFFNVVGSFGKLEPAKRDLVYVMGVAVAGSFAHNLIDYNLNFFVNLWLLFFYMAFIRSMVVKKPVKKSHWPFVISVILALVSLYEGSILIIQEFVNPKVEEVSLFPRYYYLTYADLAIQDKNYAEAKRLLDIQLDLSPLDSQALYLRGRVHCALGETEECRTDYARAIEVNPMNDFIYYRDYLKISNDPEVLNKVYDLIMNYFDLVEYNVHFTGYTGNVEAAADIINILIERLPAAKTAELPAKRQRMLEKAKMLRSTKSF